MKACYKPIRDYSKRILVKGHEVSNDQFVTGLNNHDIVVGASCAGKTGSYVSGNILTTENSMVVVDTKGQLCSSNVRYVQGQYRS